MRKGAILVVDDNMLSREFCKDLLIEDGFDVKTASTGIEALELIEDNSFDLVVADLVLPDISGHEVLKRAKQMQATTSFIVMTAYASLDTAIDCLKSGASDYLTKPLNPEEFKILVEHTIEQKRLFEENKDLKKLVKLYEVSRMLSSCIEGSRFYEVILDSLLQVVGGTSGLSIFSSSVNSPLSLKAWRGELEDAANSMADSIIKTSLSGAGNIDTVTYIPQTDDVPGARPLLLIPVKKNDWTAGYVAIFNTPGSTYSKADIENASFIAEQASMALENVYLYNQASELVYIDDLTRLHNIKYLNETLTNEIKRAKRFKSPLSALFIDVDLFKTVNDSYGHSIGNMVLFEVGQILKRCVRDIDIVSRYGGDEFTILLIGTHSDGALIIAEKIRRAIEGRIFLSEQGMSIRLTVTIGIATYPEHARDKEDLTVMADKAMYKGKTSTRNVVNITDIGTSFTNPPSTPE